ncbi:MAG: hypothetical protein A2521_02535 [Deltaproteobacteria bacterium RIFOXYD12_FULL_57_12]|nr:MAG: hypothetical protein A2521_02535 [Deltaproteobacteria bacterium RIFOXYD12_FULL_57_12]
MNQLTRFINLAKARTLVYHLPDGENIEINLAGLRHHLDLDFEVGRICDTSEIDGVIHFFPNGCA